MNIPEDLYEIIIVTLTDNGFKRKNTRTLKFVGMKDQWITAQKNMIVRNAKFENLVLMHDYLVFDKDWYSEFVKFGTDWDVCMNQILNQDNTRYRDWVYMPDLATGVWFLNYDDISKTYHMYISGAYMVVKTEFMWKYPLDEHLCWGQGEDWEWSCHVRDFWNYKMNEKSIVKLLKQKQTSVRGLFNA